MEYDKELEQHIAKAARTVPAYAIAYAILRLMNNLTWEDDWTPGAIASLEATLGEIRDTLKELGDRDRRFRAMGL